MSAHIFASKELVRALTPRAAAWLAVKLLGWLQGMDPRVDDGALKLAASELRDSIARGGLS